jgi:hypothetical protein
MAGFIERSQWETFLEDFSKRNQLRPTRLEVVGEQGDQEEEKYLPFVGVSFDAKGSAAGSIEISLGGETLKDPRYIDHLVQNAERIAPLIGETGFEEGLGIEDKDGGKTLLLFEKLTEIEGAKSDENAKASKAVH